jgi:hypothetical protein
MIVVDRRAASTSVSVQEAASLSHQHALEETPDTTSLCGLQYAAFQQVGTPTFRTIIQALTVVNVLLLGVIQPNHRSEMTGAEDVIPWVEVGLTMALVLTMCMRCVAFGPFRCFRFSFCNTLDSVCLLICVLQANPNWSMNPWIRAARAPLVIRLFVESDPLKRVMRCLRRAMPLLAQNFILVVYLMAIVCVIAVKSWMEALEAKCLAEDGSGGSQSWYLPYTTFDWPCGSSFTCSDLAIMYTPVSSLNLTCALNTSLYERQSMNYDNVAASMLTMLRVLSLDDVKQAMTDIMAISGKPFALYIVVVVVVISFLCVYLFLAILVDAFAQDRIDHASSQESTVYSFARSLQSVSGKDACVQAMEEDIDGDQQRILGDSSVLIPGHRTPNLGTFQDSILFPSATKTRLATPSVTQTATSLNEEPLEELPPWRRPIPLPFVESIRRRGLWVTIRDMECTTSHEVIIGRGRVQGARLLASRPAVVLGLLLSVVNTGCLAGISYGMEDSLRTALINTTIAATLYFSIPLGVKVVVFGPLNTSRDMWNIVDALAVGTALFEVIGRGEFESYPLIQSLRTIRALRIGKLVTPLERFTRSIFTSWRHMVELVVCYVGFIFAFAVVGMTLFGSTYVSKNPSSLPSSLWDDRMQRDTFGTIWQSMLMCFTILSGDRWTTRLQIAMEQDLPRTIASVVFFLALFLLGNYVMMNTFVVLLTEATAQTLDEEAAEVEVQHPPSLLLPLYTPPADKVNPIARHPTLVNFRKRPPTGTGKAAPDSEVTLQRPWYAWAIEVQEFRAVGFSFYFFGPTDDLRSACLVAVGSNAFHIVVVLAVLANAMLLMYESSYNNDAEQNAIGYGYLVLLIVFWVEMLMKMVAFGVVWPAPEADLTAISPHAPAFLRDPWNCLDFVTNSLCLVAQIYTPFRAAVALRTLRLASLTEYTRRILQAMIESIPQILNAIVVAMYYMTIFSVLGVQLFGGRFQFCNDRSISTQAQCNGTYTVAVVNGRATTELRAWRRSNFHFDSFPSGILSMLVIASGGMWTDIMYDGMDVGDPNDGLAENQYPLYCLFFIAAYILVNMFSLRLATALMINFLSRSTKRREGSALLTADQQKYVKARDTIDALIVHHGAEMEHLSNTLAAWLHELLSYKKRRYFKDPLFDVGVRLVVIVNSIVIITIHRNPLGFEHMLRRVVDLTALGVFVAEAIARCAAYGPRRYLSTKWNIVDLCMIPLIVLGYVFSDTEPVSFFSVVVLLKLLKGTSLEELLWYIAKNIAYYFNVLLLFFLVFFIYAAAGVIIFGQVALDVPGTNEMFNLRNVPSALLVLFATCTGRGWEPIMSGLAYGPAGCSDDGQNFDQCGSEFKSVFYFVTFIVIGVLIVLHLLVAVVVEIFRSNLDRSEPTIAAFFQLKELWDMTCSTGRISTVHIDTFLHMVPDMPTLLTGLTFARRAAFVRLIASLQIPMDQQHCVQFNDVIRAFVWRRYKVENRSALLVFQEQRTSIVQRYTVADALAAKIIQQMFRTFKQRQRDELRNRAMAIRRQMMRKRGRYEEVDESYIDMSAVGPDGQHIQPRQTASSHKIPEELLSIFAAMTNSAGRSEGGMTLMQNISDAIPEGASYVPDSILFAFGGLGGAANDSMSKGDSSQHSSTNM